MSTLPDKPPDEGDKLAPLIPVAKAYLEIRIKEMEAGARLQELQLEAHKMQESNNLQYDRDALGVEKYKFTLVFGLVALLVVFICAVTLILILRGDTTSALNILSTAVVIALALLSGPTVRKLFKQPTTKDDDGDD